MQCKNSDCKLNSSLGVLIYCKNVKILDFFVFIKPSDVIVNNFCAYILFRGRKIWGNHVDY